MAREGKRIVIRVEESDWLKFDDRRHAERTTFQDLGLRLFEEWFSGEKTGNQERTKGELHGKVDHSAEETDNTPESNGPWVEALKKILGSRNEVAVRALKSNLLAFSDYVTVAPEAADGFAEISADEKRLASLDQRMVDAGKTAAVGGGAGAPKARRRFAK